uniref:Uncharacterized protein n=1 Tax=Sarcoptes scabiei TaxID=52283 RepID=A0A834VFD6_SARSC
MLVLHHNLIIPNEKFVLILIIMKSLLLENVCMIDFFGIDKHLHPNGPSERIFSRSKLSFQSSSFSSLTPSSTKDSLESVVVDLGSVEIADRDCDLIITPFLQKCKEQYHTKILNAALQTGWNFRTESVRRASCCGIWQAKQCAIDSSRSIESCSNNITTLYERLPSDPSVRIEVFDQCSEYRENSAICQDEPVATWFTLNSLVTFLVLTMLITVMILVALKLANRKLPFLLLRCTYADERRYDRFVANQEAILNFNNRFDPQDHHHLHHQYHQDSKPKLEDLVR